MRNVYADRFTSEGMTKRGFARNVVPESQRRLTPAACLTHAQGDRDRYTQLLRDNANIRDVCGTRMDIPALRHPESEAALDRLYAQHRDIPLPSNGANTEDNSSGGGSLPAKPPTVEGNPQIIALSGGDEYPNQYPLSQKGTLPPFTPSTRPHISQGSINHVMAAHGDGTQTTQASEQGKSVFTGWSRQQVVDAIDLVITHPTLIEDFNDSFRFTGTALGVSMRVTVRVDKPRAIIWSAYPNRTSLDIL